MNMLDPMMNAGQFMSPGGYFPWIVNLIPLHAISDALVVLAYCLMPGLLIHFVRRRMAWRFHRMFICSTVCIPTGGTKIQTSHQ